MSSKRVYVEMLLEDYEKEKAEIIKQAKEDERSRIERLLSDVIKCSAPNLFTCNWPKQNIIKHVRRALGL